MIKLRFWLNFTSPPPPPPPCTPLNELTLNKRYRYLWLCFAGGTISLITRSNKGMRGPKGYGWSDSLDRKWVGFNRNGNEFWKPGARKLVGVFAGHFCKSCTYFRQEERNTLTSLSDLTLSAGQTGRTSHETN